MHCGARQGAPARSSSLPKAAGTLQPASLSWEDTQGSPYPVLRACIWDGRRDPARGLGPKCRGSTAAATLRSVVTSGKTAGGTGYSPEASAMLRALGPIHTLCCPAGGRQRVRPGTPTQAPRPSDGE